MTTTNDIRRALSNNDEIDFNKVSSGDSDDTTVIVWDTNREIIENSLEGLKFSIHIGYDNGLVIVPKK